MNTMLIIASIILVIIAGIVTVYAFKQEEKKMEKYKQEHLSAEDARKRSQEYEENSISSVVPVQFWTYLIATLVTIVLIVVFAIYY